MLNDIFHLKKQISIINNYFNIDFIYILPEDFFKLLIGDISIFYIELSNPIISDIITFILLLIMISGRCLDLEIKENILIISNYSESKKKLKLPIKKIFLQNELDYIDYNNNPEICILTFNRYKQLDRCIKSYLGNIKLFAHNNINFTVFDDSKFDIDKNIEICKSYNINLITLEKKHKYINDLVKKAPHLEDSINYTFGNKYINSSFGRNRNFISFFMKEKPYISLDDDSIPFVLTYKPIYIKEAIKKMIYMGNKNFKAIKYFITNNAEKLLLPVDFYYKFSYSNSNDYQYVKYSGNPDMELMIMFFKQIGIDYNNDKLLEYLKEEQIKDEDTRVFMKEIRRDTNMRGLCVYYPKNTYDLRVTIADNYRVEDFILGTNYLIKSNKLPLEVNIALYHDKNLNFYIRFEDIIKDFNGTSIYALYYNLMKESKFNNKIDTIDYLFNLMKKMDINFFNNENIKELNLNREKIKNLFKDLSKDYSIIKSFIPKLDYYFNKFDIDYLNNEANRVIRNLIDSLNTWNNLKDIKFI